ncbi:hypothetical protein RFI_25670 [Reticulomyxa filosa]|uniref:Uncharacterized protein n=1 Tax=Reticulomyxa filosa TaxID=46433 RepID=X6MDF6_RETFI|nr:hypothetical protein RFI_25670 [Reticulomyxa filosa]|eukprot:ETO11706.1 hypothetical protein RFI_25670 [Reticulomyxa filosa]
MLALNVERDEINLENEIETFFSSGCYNKDLVLLTNNQQKLSHLICCICNQIANNAVKLQCNEHENTRQVYLVGEKCLQTYLKQSNDKCPIQQHDHSKEWTKLGEKEGHEDECNYKGKIRRTKKNELESNAEIEKLKESDNEKIKEIQQIKQCQSAFDICIIKLEEILKSNNDKQCKTQCKDFLFF